MAQAEPGVYHPQPDEADHGIDLVHQSIHQKNAKIGEIDPVRFREYSFQPRAILAATAVGTVYFAFQFSNKCFSCSHSEDGAGGSGRLILLTWIPWAVLAVLFLCVFCMFSLPALNGFCQRNYNTIGCWMVVLSYAAFVCPFVLLEVRKANYQQESRSQTFDHIHWGINYAQFPPQSTCQNEDVRLTWLNRTDHYVPIGCNNGILGSLNYTFCLLLNLLPTVLHMAPLSSAIVAAITCILHLAALITTGATGPAMGAASSFQLVAGLLGANLRVIRTHRARADFLIEHSISRAAELNGGLLYALLPHNVAARLRRHPPGAGMLAREIPRCTVMFCRLEEHDALQAAFSPAAFDLLAELCADLDAAVRAHGMFKYQHVAGWYIVACPRAERPFDPAERRAAYPSAYTAAMVRLADDLRRAASRHSFAGAPLRLQVGIHCGPAAGAVVGAHRAFYCLYGDTVNTAARMCKCAGGGPPRCSAEFAAEARALPAACGVRVESCGMREVKGKGLMETFRLLLDPAPSTAPAPAPLRPSSWQQHPLPRPGPPPDPLPPPVPRPVPSSSHSHSRRPSVGFGSGPRLQSTKWRRMSNWVHAAAAAATTTTTTTTTTASPCPEGRPGMGAQLVGGGGGGAAAAGGVPLDEGQGQGGGHPEAGPSSPAGGGAGGEEVGGGESGAGGDDDPLDDTTEPGDDARAGRLHWLWCQFADAEVERRFQAGEREYRRAGLTTGAVMHVGAVVVQYVQVRYQRDFDLEATGDQALASGKRAVIAALTAHAIAAVAAVAALLAAAWARPRLVPFAAAGFAAVQAAHLAVGIVCLARLPGDGWLAGFPVEYLLVTSWLAIQPFRPAAAMTTAALLVHVVALPAVRPYSTANIRLIRAVGPMALRAGALLLCRAAALDARARFWRAELLAEELSQLRSKLLDLLPAAVARSIALAAAASGGLARLPCESCRAVVLQEMAAMEVAQLMHQLFTKFDSTVTEAGLYKMDTIGDAYVAAVLLPHGSPAHVEAAACCRVLAAARGMINAVVACRQATGRTGLACRIGVAVGGVLAGVLGQLQPRFHIFGAGIHVAELHEQAGQIDAVHASAAFVAALAVLCSCESQCSFEAQTVLHGKPVCQPSSLEKISWHSPLEDKVAECGIADAALEAGVDLLIGGSLEEVGSWSVRQSDYCVPCPAANGGTASAVESNAEVPPSPCSCPDAETGQNRKVRSSYSFILVPAAPTTSQLTRRNSEPTVKYGVLMETPPLPPRKRRASMSVPSLLDSSDDTEPLLFGAMMPASSLRPVTSSHEVGLEAKLFVA